MAAPAVTAAAAAASVTHTEKAHLLDLAHRAARLLEVELKAVEGGAPLPPVAVLPADFKPLWDRCPPLHNLVAIAQPPPQNLNPVAPVHTAMHGNGAVRSVQPAAVAPTAPTTTPEPVRPSEAPVNGAHQPITPLSVPPVVAAMPPRPITPVPTVAMFLPPVMAPAAVAQMVSRGMHPAAAAAYARGVPVQPGAMLLPVPAAVGQATAVAPPASASTLPPRTTPGHASPAPPAGPQSVLTTLTAPDGAGVKAAATASVTPPVTAATPVVPSPTHPASTPTPAQPPAHKAPLAPTALGKPPGDTDSSTMLSPSIDGRQGPSDKADNEGTASAAHGPPKPAGGRTASSGSGVGAGSTAPVPTLSSRTGLAPDPFDVKKELLTLQKDMWRHKVGPLFHAPVTDEEAPGYSAKITRPMDLTTIRNMINAGQVSTVNQIRDLMTLMTENCIQFNGLYTEYGQYGVELRNYMLPRLEEAEKRETAAAAAGVLVPNVADGGGAGRKRGRAEMAGSDGGGGGEAEGGDDDSKPSARKASRRAVPEEGDVDSVTTEDAGGSGDKVGSGVKGRKSGGGSHRKKA